MNKDPEKRVPSAMELARRVERSTQERVYLNPLRPYLSDLVPELKTLDEKQRLHVTQEAERRRGRNKQVMARHAILSIPAIIYSISTLTFMFLSLPLDTLVKDYRTMDTRIATLNTIIRSQSEPGTYPESFFETQARASDTIAETYRGKGYYIMTLIFGTSLLLLIGYVALAISLMHAGRASLAPYIREVLTELETRGHFGISEAAGKKLHAQQGFALVAGMLLGGAVGFLLHRHLGLGPTAQTLIMLGGCGLGGLVAGVSFPFYMANPSRSDID